MNRSERRRMERDMKKKMSDEQFNELKNEALEDVIHERASQMFVDFTKVLIKTMRNNRISEKRVNKIFEETFIKLKEDK